MGTARKGATIIEYPDRIKRYCVNIPAYFGRKRERKLFARIEEAEEWRDKRLDALRRHGYENLERHEHGKTVGEAIRQYESRKEMKGYNKRNSESHLKRFAAIHGPSPIALITPLDLDSFVRGSDWRPATQAHCFRYIRAFFNWAERYDIIERNPARRMEPPKVGESEKTILTPDQMKALLAAATPQQRAFLCLGGFAGLRTSECMRVKLEDVDKTQVFAQGKTGKRYVDRLPVFDQFWPGVPIDRGLRMFYKDLKDLCKVIGKTSWPDNCLRHSFASYHLAMWGDAGKTAHQMGHTSTAMVYRAYARAVKKSDAEAWWGIVKPRARARKP